MNSFYERIARHPLAKSEYIPRFIKRAIRYGISGLNPLTRPVKLKNLTQNPDAVMTAMDHWVQNHPWARGGWVPPNRLTSDYVNVFPNEKPDQVDSPPPIQQVRSEIAEVVREIFKRRLNGGKVVEIGMGMVGGSHVLWRSMFSKVITLELIQETVNRFHREETVNPFQSIFIVGDSRSEEVVKRTFEVGADCDVLLIDGDHTAVGVRADWKNYHRLVKPGGMIIFHDTQLNGPPEIEVKAFVDELESGKVTGKPIQMHHIRHSRIVGISYYIQD